MEFFPSNFLFTRRPNPSPNIYDLHLRNLTARLQAEYESRRQFEKENPVRFSTDKPIENLPLEISSVNLHIEENALSHHTDKYKITKKEPKPHLVIRRGATFLLSILGKRDYNFTKDKIIIEFNFGPNPNIAKKTKIELDISIAYNNDKDWTCQLIKSSGKELQLSVIPACDAMIGIWKMEVVTSLNNNPKQKFNYNLDDDMYIICNPWCKNDVVYLEDDQLRQEYILNDHGKIWIGTYNNYRGRRWVFGQFDDVVLPTCMLLFERTNLDVISRGNPIRIVRAISAGVNVNDEKGIIEGKWKDKAEDYVGGKAPWEWTGSISILEEYMKGEGQPVKYGQCWVFAGVAATLCRALGIPCRCVTNYISAHDTDESLTIDQYFDESGKPLKNNDSTWTFHVWNDVWMARPDLKPGYGGWQIIDATPQETSDGKFQVGPCSLVAVRKGHIGHLYDTPFIFAEVNADIIHWQDNGQGEYKKIAMNEYHVGRLIMTKSPYMDDDFEDRDGENITHEYKSIEGSAEERLIVLNAFRARGLFDKVSAPQPEKDMSFDLLEIDTIMIGENFEIKLNMKNKSKDERHVTASLLCFSVIYNGAQGYEIKNRKYTLTIKPNTEIPARLTVTPYDYLAKLVDQGIMKIYAKAIVSETQQTYSKEDDFVVIKPKLIIEVSDALTVNVPFDISFSFSNPLSSPLTECKLSLEAVGLIRPIFLKQKDIQISEVMNHIETLTPRDSGKFKIVAAFNSRELTDIIGSKTIEIQK